MRQSLTFLCAIIFVLNISAQNANWLRGYTEDVQGEVLTYHAPHPEVTTSLLIRNQDSTKYIAWLMDEVPENTDAKEFTFVWIFGIDVNEKSYPYKLYLDDQYLLSFRNPRDTVSKKWTIRSPEGVSLSFNASLVDKYGDLMGYAFLTVPSKMLKEGHKPEIKITATSSDDPCWYMTHRYAMNSSLLAKQMPAIMNAPDGERYVLRFDIHHFGENTHAVISAKGEKREIPIRMGVNYTYFPVSGKAGDMIDDISINIDGHIHHMESISLTPVRPMSLYLLHHSHSDIGYTHHQSVVEKMHHDFFRQVVELHDETADYPPGSRFKWNVEVCWAVESYLEKCSKDEKENFFRVVQAGGIGLDGLWANELTAICSPEELIQLIQRSAKVARECGTELRSAMITDIPGYTWSLVPVMAKSGIRYFSPGTNTFHRIGDIKDTWGDKPFYWVSKSGLDSVLTWFPARGYSWFHTGLGAGEPKNLLTEEPIFEYVDQLSEETFPYEMSIIRYNIGSDNGPPHKALPDIVRDWNEKYITPKMYIATTAEAFGIFEEKYGRVLPSFAGDLTPYWEDGASSSARETALVNAAAERLEQAQSLWVISGIRDYPVKQIGEAWKNILLYDEHTWGSWNSISAPHDPFTLEQWKTKQSFAIKADSITSSIMQQAIGKVKHAPAGDIYAFDIWNTHSWPVTDIVIVPVPEGAGNIYVADQNGNHLKTQYMSDGRLAVLLRDVPPLSATKIIIREEKHFAMPLPLRKHSGLEVSINPQSGDIDSLRYKNFEGDMVNHLSEYGMNSYVYVEGRDPANKHFNENVRVSQTEKGPLVNSIRIESDAPGTEGLIREVRIFNGLDRVDIKNTLLKSEVYAAEGVHFAFPFNIPGGDVRINQAWDYYMAGEGQLPGSNLNFSPLSRWVDVSSETQGVCMVSLDAPLVEIGEISMDALSFGYKDEQEAAQSIFSYVMNNYWETNYLAAQPGKASFRYSLYPHESFDPVFNIKRALERSQPLVVVPASETRKTSMPLISTDNQNVLITAFIPGSDGMHFLMRIYNPTGEDQVVTFRWNLLSPITISFSSSGLSGQDKIRSEEPFEIRAHDFQTIRVDL